MAEGRVPARDHSGKSLRQDGSRLKAHAFDYNDEEELILRREWKRGTHVKIIAILLEEVRGWPRSNQSIVTKRKKMGLSIRRRRSKEIEDWARASTTMRVSLRDQAVARAWGQGKTLSAYMRYLVERDLGFPS